jgi:hypothetical protein
LKTGWPNQSLSLYRIMHLWYMVWHLQGRCETWWALTTSMLSCAENENLITNCITPGQNETLEMQKGVQVVTSPIPWIRRMKVTRDRAKVATTSMPTRMRSNNKCCARIYKGSLPSSNTAATPVLCLKKKYMTY